jgi:hypothetical protein
MPTSNPTPPAVFHDLLDDLPKPPADTRHGDGPGRLRSSITFIQEDAAFLRGVHGRAGTHQQTANWLLRLLVNEMKKRGLDSYNPDSYEKALAGASIKLGKV